MWHVWLTASLDLRSLLACLLLLPVCTDATAAAPGTRNLEQLPRLEDGHVDLQGIWSLSNLTPLERGRDHGALVISTETADAIVAGMRNARLTQPTGGPDVVFDDDRSMQPIRGEWRSSVIVTPEDGRIPGNALFKDKVAHFRAGSTTAADGPEQRPPAERCLLSPAAAPPMLSVPTLNLHQIVQTRDTILIQSEWNREARIVRMHAKHAPASVTSWLGDSIGWWEGNTLVIETKHFAPASELRFTTGILFYLSPDAIVTERLTRTDAETLHYRFTVEDPTYYTSAWRGENELRRSDARILEFACHEGNYALTFVLQGARANDGQRNE